MTKKIIYLNSALLNAQADLDLDSKKQLEKFPIAGAVNLSTAKIYRYYFEISPLNVSNGAKMKVVNLIHDHKNTNGNTNGNSEKLNIIFKIDGISINSSYYVSNDGSYPTLIAFDTFNPSFYLGNELTLNKQTINYINIYGTDNISNVMGGIKNDINFIIILEIEEIDNE